jgi:hypothetical protein
VQTVHGTSGETGELGSTYSMQREIPSGQVENDLEVFVREHPTEFGIRTTSGPTPFLYRYRFTSDGTDTVVHLDASVSCPLWQPCSGRSQRGDQARRQRELRRPQARTRGEKRTIRVRVNRAAVGCRSSRKQRADRT